jgi:hypothetical protein
VIENLAPVLGNTTMPDGGKKSFIPEGQDELGFDESDLIIQIRLTRLDVSIGCILVEGSALDGLGKEDARGLDAHLSQLKLEVLLVGLTVGHLTNYHDVRLVGPEADLAHNVSCLAELT